MKLAVIFWICTAALGGGVQEPAPPVDAEADRLLREMSDTLSKAPRFALEAEEIFDEIPDVGPRRELANVRSVVMERPNRAVADVVGETRNRTVWFDRGRLTVLDKEQNVYGTLEGLPTVDAMLDWVAEDYGIEVPLADLLFSDANTFYKQMAPHSFVVVAKPAGVIGTAALPADVEPVEAGGNDLVAQGQIVATKGSRVQGKVREANHAEGSQAPLLALELTGVASGGRMIPITTNVTQSQGKASQTGKKLLAGAATGATIGAIADGGEGAAVGGIAGAMVGGVAGAATTKEVTMAAGTVLEFKTNQVATFYKNVTVQTNAEP